jgi:hypothetical protein
LRHHSLLIAQTKVINETFLKLFAVKAQPYFKKSCCNIDFFYLFPSLSNCKTEIYEI